MLSALRRLVRARGIALSPHAGLANARRADRPEEVEPPGRPGWAHQPASALLGALMGMASAAGAAEADFGPPGAAFVLRAQGRCLEVNEPQLRVDGARVHLQRCDGEPIVARATGHV